MWRRIPAVQSISAIGMVLLNIISWIPPLQDVVSTSNIDIRWVNLVLFMAFCGVLYWIIHDLYEGIRELEDSKPSILVIPTRNCDNLCLNVINEGERGEFVAQIGIVYSSIEMPFKFESYRGIWNSTETDEVSIMKGHAESIRIATITTGKKTISLSLYAYDKAHKRVHIIPAGNWMPTIDKSIIKPEYQLQVTISSSPSLKEKLFYRNYDVTLDEIRESKRQPSLRHMCIVADRRIVDTKE